MKAGDTYQDIVTAVAKAIHPSAEVTKADWVDGYILGPFDGDAWRMTDQEWDEEMEPEPGTFKLRMTLMNPVHRVDGDVPDVEAAALEREITTSPPFPSVA